MSVGVSVEDMLLNVMPLMILPASNPKRNDYSNGAARQKMPTRLGNLQFGAVGDCCWRTRRLRSVIFSAVTQTGRAPRIWAYSKAANSSPSILGVVYFSADCYIDLVWCRHIYL